MEKQSNMQMHAYVVLLHLVSQGYSNFTEIREVLCRESQGIYYTTILDYIVRKIDHLKEEWNEDIPPITALVFNTDGSAPKWVCQIIAGDRNLQPSLQQIAKLSANVASYDKWNKVLEELKKETLNS